MLLLQKAWAAGDSAAASSLSRPVSGPFSSSKTSVRRHGACSREGVGGEVRELRDGSEVRRLALATAERSVEGAR